MFFCFLFYIGKAFITTDPSESQKILERSKNSRKTGGDRSTSPDATREALEKRRRSRKKSRSLLPLVQLLLKVCGRHGCLFKNPCFCHGRPKIHDSDNLWQSKLN